MIVTVEQHAYNVIMSWVFFIGSAWVGLGFGHASFNPMEWNLFHTVVAIVIVSTQYLYEWRFDYFDRSCKTTEY